MTGYMIIPTANGFETYETGKTVGKDTPLATHSTVREALAHLRTILLPPIEEDQPTSKETQ